MQRKTNRERTETTRARLLEAGRALFVSKGYADTGTPEIVATADLTRGALYHHFPDKQALFAAVVETEAAAVAAEIEQAVPMTLDAVSALLTGGEAYLSVMQQQGRARLLLLDGPSVLGRARMDEIDDAHGNRTLREGLEAAMNAGALKPLPLDALTVALGAMFDRAVLALIDGGDLRDQMAVLGAVIKGLQK
ncbi:TetR/AcrR family transcriptional regulator [Nitratireductor luteus]|uniref:TetR/AcrR family transcriptional regulator n=1 Tax=Nitratireductor luteus TaxID=2976980 RepID=UPI002240BD8C|nr:TetR/AcrR family transcriptional regulator [Nitratireductor luteus]